MDWRKLRDKLRAEEKARPEETAPEIIDQSTAQDGPPPAAAPLAEPEGSGKTAARQISPPNGPQAELAPPPSSPDSVSWENLKEEQKAAEERVEAQVRAYEEEQERLRSEQSEAEPERAPESSPEARKPETSERSSKVKSKARKERSGAINPVKSEEDEEATHLAEEARKDAERRAEEAREDERLAEEAHQDAERRAEVAREEERLAEEARLDAERRAEEARKAEEERLFYEELEREEAAKKAEEDRKAEEARKAEEERLAEEARKAEEERLAEEARKAEEERQAEEARKAEEERQAEEARKAEEERQAEEARKAEEERLAEEEERQAEEEREAIKLLAEQEKAQQADAEPPVPRPDVFRAATEARRELKPHEESRPARLEISGKQARVVPPAPAPAESGEPKKTMVKPPSVKPPGGAAKPPTWLGGGSSPPGGAKPPSWARGGSGEAPGKVESPGPGLIGAKEESGAMKIGPIPKPPSSVAAPGPADSGARRGVAPASADSGASKSTPEAVVTSGSAVASVSGSEVAEASLETEVEWVEADEEELEPEAPVAAARPEVRLELRPDAQPRPAEPPRPAPQPPDETPANLKVRIPPPRPTPVAPEPVEDHAEIGEESAESGPESQEMSESGGRYRSKLASSSTSAERRTKQRAAGLGAKAQGLKSKSLKAEEPPPPPPPPPPEPEPEPEPEPIDTGGVNWKVGDIIDGKFEVKELVGAGGMGTVWRVRHWEWNIDLAVKAPMPNLVADWADKERLILEAHTWVDLGVHPNIVQCWFVREYDGVPLLFLDYLSGGSLRDHMLNGNVRPGDWLKILDLSIQACDGLAHAHDHGLIHRDVKPANLLIGENGQLCVTDFGLVKVKKDDGSDIEREEIDRARLQAVHSETDLSLTATGTVMGTPHYAAPEQWLGQSVGIQADVYAMGILMFELCCGTRPFDLTDQTMSITHLVTCHVYQPPPDPQTLNPDIPESLANCIVHCLLKNPEDRPQSMRELRETLANIYQEIDGRPHPRPVPRAGVQRAAALNNKAVSLWNLNKTQEAFDAWREASKLDALHPESVYNRSMLQWRLGQIDHEEVLRRLTQVSSHYRRASAYLGYYHIERHNPGEAETIMQNGISMPELAADGAVWRTMGDARMSLEQYPEAVRAYRQALQRIPEDRETQNRLEMAQERRRTRNDKVVFPLSQPRRILRREGRVSAMAADHKSLVLAGDNLLEKMDLETSYSVWQWKGEGNVREINRLCLTDDYVLSLDTPDGRIWSRETGECLHTLGDGERFYAVLPGGKLAIAGLIDLKLVSLPDCKRVKALKGHSKQVTSVAITPDGRLALTGSCDRTARLWELPSGEMIRVLEGHKDMVDAVAISPDGTVGLSGGRDRAVRLWLLAGGDWIGTLGDHAGDVQSIKMTHDGRYAVISCATSEDNQLCVWDLQQASRLFVRQGVAALAPDGNYLLAGTRAARPPRVNLWEIPSGRSVRTLEGHSAGICAICFTPDGQLAATASENGQVQVWEIAESTRFYDRSLVVTRTHSHGEAESARQKFLSFLEQARKAPNPGAAYKQLNLARQVLGYDRDPEALAINASLLSQLPRKALKAVWELRTFTEPSQTEICAVALTGDGRLAVSAAGKIIRLWDLSTGSCVRGFAGHADKVKALALAEDGRRVVSGSLDKSLRVWNVQTGDLVHSLTEHNEGVIAVAVTPGGQTAVSVTVGNQIHVWDLAHGNCSLAFSSGPTLAVALTDDGKTLLSAGDSDGSSMRLVNLATGKLIRSDFKASGSKRDSLNGTALDMTADARFALVAGLDFQLRLWDLAEGVTLRQLAGHTARVNSLKMTDDGRYAVTASNDCSVRLWDVVAGTCLNTFQGHNGPVLCADMSPDGRFVLSAGADQSFRLWELDWELDPDQPLTPLADAFPKKGLFKKVLGVFKKS